MWELWDVCVWRGRLDQYSAMADLKTRHQTLRYHTTTSGPGNSQTPRMIFITQCNPWEVLCLCLSLELTWGWLEVSGLQDASGPTVVVKLPAAAQSAALQPPPPAPPPPPSLAYSSLAWRGSHPSSQWGESSQAWLPSLRGKHFYQTIQRMRSELAQWQLPPSNSPVLSYHSGEAVIARRHHRGGNGGYKPFLLTVFSITYTDSGLHRTNNRTISNMTFLAINNF